jgi:predicted O-methyltransferase YrrM
MWHIDRGFVDIAYWTRAGRSLVRNSRNLSFLLDVARSGIRADERPKAPSLYLLDLYPDAEDLTVDLGAARYRRSNLDPMEQFAVCAIAQLRKPTMVFEFGTFDGATTLLLARNLPSARIVTLDLDRVQAQSATVEDEIANARDGVGSRFAGSAESARIEQLLGDSRQFDFSPWYGAIDLVIVDAGHDYACASADTTTALRLVRPGGVVVWDDYTTGWPDVVRAVDETGRKIFHLAGTDLAVLDEQVFPPS